MGKKGIKKKTIWRSLPIAGNGATTNGVAQTTNTEVKEDRPNDDKTIEMEQKNNEEICKSSTSTSLSELSNNENRNNINLNYIKYNSNNHNNNSNSNINNNNSNTYPSSYNTHHSHNNINNHQQSSYSYKRRPFTARNNTNYNTGGGGVSYGSYNRSNYRSSYNNNYYNNNDRDNSSMKTSTSSTATTPSTPSTTFNEDEYTRITTPRQDVLFKKGYLSRPKKYSTFNTINNLNNDTNTSSSGTVSIVSTEESTTPSTQSVSPENFNLINEIPDSEYSYLYPSYIDQNGLFFVNPYMSNGFDPYGGQMLMMPYAGANCQPLNVNHYDYYDNMHLPPYLNQKRLSVDSQNNTNETSSPQTELSDIPNEETTINDLSENINEVEKTDNQTDINVKDDQPPVENPNCQYHNPTAAAMQPFYSPVYYPYIYGPPSMMSINGLPYNSNPMQEYNVPYDNSTGGNKQYRFKKRKRKPRKHINSTGEEGTTENSEDDEMSNNGEEEEEDDDDDEEEDDEEEEVVVVHQPTTPILSVNSLEFQPKLPVLIENTIIITTPTTLLTSTEEHFICTTENNLHKTTVQTSNLNVEVKEFLPRNYQQQQNINNNIDEVQQQIMPTTKNAFEEQIEKINKKSDNNNKNTNYNNKSDLVNKNNKVSDVTTTAAAVNNVNNNNILKYSNALKKSNDNNLTVVESKIIKENGINNVNKEIKIKEKNKKTGKKFTKEFINNNNNSSSTQSQIKNEAITLNEPTYAQMLNNNHVNGNSNPEQLKLNNEEVVQNKSTNGLTKLLQTQEKVTPKWQTVRPKGKRRKQLQTESSENLDLEEINWDTEDLQDETGVNVENNIIIADIVDRKAASDIIITEVNSFENSSQTDSISLTNSIQSNGKTNNINNKKIKSKNNNKKLMNKRNKHVKNQQNNNGFEIIEPEFHKILSKKRIINDLITTTEENHHISDEEDEEEINDNDVIVNETLDETKNESKSVKNGNLYSQNGDAITNNTTNNNNIIIKDDDEQTIEEGDIIQKLYCSNEINSINNKIITSDKKKDSLIVDDVVVDDCEKDFSNLTDDKTISFTDDEFLNYLNNDTTIYKDFDIHDSASISDLSSSTSSSDDNENTIITTIPPKPIFDKKQLNNNNTITTNGGYKDEKLLYNGNNDDIDLMKLNENIMIKNYSVINNEIKTTNLNNIIDVIDEKTFNSYLIKDNVKVVEVEKEEEQQPKQNGNAYNLCNNKIDVLKSNDATDNGIMSIKCDKVETENFTKQTEKSVLMENVNDENFYKLEDTNENNTKEKEFIKESSCNELRFPITDAVSKWLHEKQKEPSPEPILRLPNDPILSKKIGMTIMKRTSAIYNTDEELITTDDTDNDGDYDYDDDDNDDDDMLKNDHKKVNVSKNLKGNPLHVSSLNSSIEDVSSFMLVCDDNGRRQFLADTDSDYMSDGQMKQQNDKICKRVAKKQQHQQQQFKTDDEIILLNPFSSINNNNQNNDILEFWDNDMKILTNNDNNINKFQNMEDIKFNKITTNTNNINNNNNNNKKNAQINNLANNNKNIINSFENDLEIYESVYGKSINYNNLLSDKNEFLSNNILLIEKNRSNIEINNQINSNNKNNHSPLIENNIIDTTNKIDNENTINNNNCIKPPFTEVCCVLM